MFYNILPLQLLILAFIETGYMCPDGDSRSEKKFVRTVYVEESKLVNGELVVDSLLAEYVTHVVYAFAGLDRTTYEGLQLNYADEFKKLFVLKQYGVYVMMGVGGWGDSKSDYVNMLNDDEKRGKYAKNVAKFIKDNQLQGIDMDLEYPCCWQLECDEKCFKDRENFTHLLELLRNELDKVAEETGEHLFLTVAVYPAKSKLSLIYEVEKLSAIVDYINVITYDLHVGTESAVMPGAAFTKPKAESSKELSVKASISAWLDLKAEQHKLVVGIPFYATSFTLANKNNHCIGDAAKGVGKLVTPPFKQVVDTIQEGGWEVIETPYTTFATKEDQWMAYDDLPDVARKANYVRKHNLAGIMVWTIDKDYLSDGPCGKYPLISTIHSALNGLSKNVQSCTKQFAITQEPSCTDF